MRILIILLSLIVLSGTASALTPELLPEGTGLVSLAERHFDAQTEGYGDAGQHGPIADTTQAKLGHLLEQVGLGLDVHAQVDATILAAAYGVSSNWTFFMAVPYVLANINANLLYGQNDPAAVDATMAQLGYAPMSPLTRAGFGDTLIGMRTVVGDGRLQLIVEPSVSLPTGYVKDPSILQDVSLGSGYFIFGLGLTPKLSYGDFFLKTPIALKASPSTTVEARVPDVGSNVILVDSSHQHIIDLYPGTEVDAALKAGWDMGLFGADGTWGMTHHYRDVFSGPEPGNYAFLDVATERILYFADYGVKFSAVDLYKSGKIFMPFVVRADYFMTLAGRNVNDARFFEVSFTTFFK